MHHHHHHHHGHSQKQGGRYADIRRVTLVGAVINIILAALKIFFGWMGHSQALLADGLHSLSDLISDAVVLVAAKHGSHHADQEHPYGHARIETAATVVVGALLILVAVEFMLEAGGLLLSPENLWKPTPIVLFITLLSIALKEGLYHYTRISADKLKSSLLRANAWHHRSDSLSSIIVLVGVGGVMLGVSWLDAAAAIVVSLMIAHIGWELSSNGFKELIDTGLEKEKLAEIREVINNTYGVQALHELRTRRMGEEALVDVHILVNENLSVSEGHQISEAVRNRLIKKVDEIYDVMVHIDPEDDQKTTPNSRLPLRNDILQRLHAQWKGVEAAQNIEHITLHYLSGKVNVDVQLPLQLLNNLEEARLLGEKLQEQAQRDEYIGRVRVFYF